MSAEGFEPSDARPAGVARWAAGLTAVIVLTFVAARAVYLAFERRRGPPTVSATEPPAAVAGRMPRLQVDPAEDLRSLRRWEEERLESYGWVDRRRRVVHIPVPRAMELLVRRGIRPGPARAPAFPLPEEARR